MESYLKKKHRGGKKRDKKKLSPTAKWRMVNQKWIGVDHSKIIEVR